MSEKTETRASGVRIWHGKLRLNAERKKEGPEVEARILLTGASVVFEVDRGGGFIPADADEIHAASWLRALGATGTEVP
jgi:hypothetical protein